MQISIIVTESDAGGEFYSLLTIILFASERYAPHRSWRVSKLPFKYIVKKSRQRYAPHYFSWFHKLLFKYIAKKRSQFYAEYQFWEVRKLSFKVYCEENHQRYASHRRRGRRRRRRKRRRRRNMKRRRRWERALTDCWSKERIAWVSAGHSPLSQSSFSNISVTSSTSQLILQPFRRFIYVTAHSPTIPSLYLRHSSCSNPSVASPTS